MNKLPCIHNRTRTLRVEKKMMKKKSEQKKVAWSCFHRSDSVARPSRPIHSFAREFDFSTEISLRTENRQPKWEWSYFLHVSTWNWSSKYAYKCVRVFFSLVEWKNQNFFSVPMNLDQCANAYAPSGFRIISWEYEDYLQVPSVISM